MDHRRLAPFHLLDGAGAASLDLQTNQVVGQSLYDFFRTEDPTYPSIQAHLQALQGQTASYEQAWHGQVYQVRVEPLLDPEKGITGCSGVALEITDRKRTEENLQRAQEDLNQRVAQRTAALAKANEALGQLLDERAQVAEALYEQNAILQAVLDGTTDAIYVKDLQGRYLLINAAGARFLDRPVEEILGQDDRVLFSPETAAAIMAQDRLVLASGQTQTVEDVGTAGGQTRTYLSTKGPYRDAEGQLIGIFGISHDISDRKRAEKRLAAEHAVARALSESASFAEAAPRIIQAICENLAWTTGAVWNFDRHAQVLRCQEFWHVPHHPVPEFEAITRAMTVPPGTKLAGQAWSTGQAVWVTDVSQDSSSLRARAAADGGIHVVLATPILSANAVLGVLEFSDVTVRQPDADLLDMLSCIGSQIAQFIERRQAEAILIEREQEFRLARRIQEGLLPRAAPQLPGLDIAGASRAAQETGGDYFDYLPLPDGCLGVAIGDASGHGIGAALLIVQTRAYLRTFAQEEGDFGQILPLVNRRITQEGTDPFFVTLFLACLDPQTLDLSYCNAGHPAGIVLDQEGKVKHRLTSTATPLGVLADEEFPVSTSPRLEPGDLVLLVTDGVMENGPTPIDLFGFERALDLVRAHRHRTAAEVVHLLLEAVHHYCDDLSPQDDMTVVVIKVGRGASSSEV